MPWLEIAGARYFYLERGPAGAGRQLLFLHGSGGSSRHWVHQLALAGPDVRVWAPDLPGHGKSEGSPSDRIDVYREFVDQLAGALLKAPFYLAGHSMGGAIALAFARLHPEQLAGLILVGTGARLKVSPAVLESFGAGRPYPELVELAYGPASSPPLREEARRELETVDPRTYFADFSACNAFDMMDDLPVIRVRTLVLVGGQDRLTPPRYARYLGEHLPQAGVVTVEDAGHMLMLEKPAAVNNAVLDFLAASG